MAILAQFWTTVKDRASSTWDCCHCHWSLNHSLLFVLTYLASFLPLLHRCWYNSIVNILPAKLQLRTQPGTRALYYLVLVCFFNFTFGHWCPETLLSSLLSVLGLFILTSGSLHLMLPLHESSSFNSNSFLSIFNLNVTSSAKPSLTLLPLS